MQFYEYIREIATLIIGNIVCALFMYVYVCVFVFTRLHHFYHHLLLLLHHNYCALPFVLCRINVDLFASTHSSWFCTPASKYGNSYLIFSQKYGGVLSPPLAVLPCASLCLYYHHSVLQVCVCMYVYMHVCRHKQKSAPPPFPPPSPPKPPPRSPPRPPPPARAAWSEARPAM